MQQNSIRFGFTARYFQLGKISEETTDLIFVLHGYGQQARYFLRKFQALEKPENCIIAPEGLSRFYLQGFHGRVGATWMTKEDRLTDIENYITYLNAIFDQVTSLKTNLKITILGFSQGAATATRWALDNHMVSVKLVLWAGIFPPDMDFRKASFKLKERSVYYVYGTEDPFLKDDTLKEMKALSEKAGVTPIITTFEGGHDIHKDTLTQIFL